MTLTLETALERFTTAALSCREEDLERPWQWQGYDSEGARFIFFRAYEALRTLAAQLRQAQAPGEAQLILGNYHTAYRALTARLLGLAEADFDLAPAPGEWPLRQVLEHIIVADMSFFVVFVNARRHLHDPHHPLARPSEAFWAETIGMSDPELEALFRGPLQEVLSTYQRFHRRVLDELASLANADLDLPAPFWEEERFSLRFRLHRFDSHLRQHTIQVEKTLDAIGRQPDEVARLLQLVHAAWADAESARIGREGEPDGRERAAAEQIAWLASELAHARSTPT